MTFPIPFAAPVDPKYQRFSDGFQKYILDRPEVADLRWGSWDSGGDWYTYAGPRDAHQSRLSGLLGTPKTPKHTIVCLTGTLGVHASSAAARAFIFGQNAPWGSRPGVMSTG
jgi:hypothetical protein